MQSIQRLAILFLPRRNLSRSLHYINVPSNAVARCHDLTVHLQRCRETTTLFSPGSNVDNAERGIVLFKKEMMVHQQHTGNFPIIL